MTDYTEEDMLDAFQRGYACQYFRGNVNDVEKLDQTSLDASKMVFEKWMKQLNK